MSRYINKYDKAINKYIDDIYLKLKGKKELLDSSKVIKSIITENISRKILRYYIFLYYLFNNYSKLENIKNKLLVDKIISSSELVDVLNLLDTINLIKKIVNMEDKEKLISPLELIQ